MSAADDAAKQIRFDLEGITIGDERVPGVIEDLVTVQEEGVTPGVYRVSVTFLTTVMPVSAPGLVDQPIDTRVIRPAGPGDD